jgi:hypothetical protein
MKEAVDTYIAAKIVSTDPLITISGTNLAAPLGIASVAPDLFAGRKALHLLHHTWNLIQGDATWIAAAIAEAEETLPDSRFLILASNDLEVRAASVAGAEAIMGSGLILVDERVWRPAPTTHPRQFDASYVARLDKGKRHHLAAGIGRVQLIYGYELDAAKDGRQRVAEALPRATFVNHELGEGKYVFMSPQDVTERLARSSVGLCLSAVEGCMRASIEYMLCGLAVVSTPAVGGRDRYFVGSYTRIVEDNPEAVAKAVTELARQNFDPMRIRQHIGEIIAFERHNLRLALNAIVEKQFGIVGRFRTIEPLLGSISSARHSSALYKWLQQALGDQPADPASP